MMEFIVIIGFIATLYELNKVNKNIVAGNTLLLERMRIEGQMNVDPQFPPD